MRRKNRTAEYKIEEDQENKTECKKKRYEEQGIGDGIKGILDE